MFCFLTNHFSILLHNTPTFLRCVFYNIINCVYNVCCSWWIKDNCIFYYSDINRIKMIHIFMYYHLIHAPAWSFRISKEEKELSQLLQEYSGAATMVSVTWGIYMPSLKLMFPVTCFIYVRVIVMLRKLGQFSLFSLIPCVKLWQYLGHFDSK